MTKFDSKIGVFLGAAALAALAGQASAQTVCNRSGGPDVIVGNITGPQNYTAVGTLEALSLGTDSCNVGNLNLLWNASPANTHPVIGGTLYRYSIVDGAGRFEMIGQSWLKHAFTALTGNLCCSCNGQGGSVLGVGCSDPYTASRNGSQGGLGPKYQINATLGAYPTGTPPRPSGGNNGRLEVDVSDLVVTAGGPTAAVRYFGEAQYVTPDDATRGNGLNNASIREITTSGSGTTWTFGFFGSTIRERSAIQQWKVIDPSVTESTVLITTNNVPNPPSTVSNPAPATVQEKFIVSSKATDLNNGMWRYEFAVYNMNSHRSAGSFSVPVADGVTITNIGFHDVAYRAGDGVGGVNYSGTDWTANHSNGVLTWSTETEAQNPNANAIRWGTTYNFRFDADVAPADSGNVTIGLWRSGSPALASVQAAAQVPGLPNCVADVDDGSGTGTPDGGVTIDDMLYYLTIFEAGSIDADVDDGSGAGTPDGGVTIDDLLYYLTRFEAGC
jgi:hypothetical protein